jgi:phage gp16-like protein
MSVQPERRARLAKVHVAKKQLALEDDSYRALLMRVTGKSSSADCTDAQLDAVLGEFARLGFTADKPRQPPSDKAYVRMIYAIWKDLKPYLTDHSRRALQSFVKRQTDVDAPEFLNPEDANIVVEGLKAWLARERAKAVAAKRAAGKQFPKMRRRPAGLPPVEHSPKK